LGYLFCERESGIGILLRHFHGPVLHFLEAGGRGLAAIAPIQALMDLVMKSASCS
jgi:hypothetical protein